MIIDVFFSGRCMRRIYRSLLFACLLSGIAQGVFAQRSPVTPFAIFDRFGQELAVSDIDMRSGKYSGGSINSMPTNSCSAGYFTLWFPQGSLYDQNSTARNLICELFTNISGFISSPLSVTGQQVNILCADYTGTVLTTAAVATSYYVFPNTPLNPNSGIIESQVQRAILTGVNPYLNIPLSFMNAAQVYHGAIHTSTTAPWSYATGATTIAPGTIDFYSNHLHEIGHLLGIQSLINGDGYSVFGQNNNYFGVYDKFLVDHTGTSLISSSTPTSCPNSNVTFTPSLLTSIASTSSGCIKDVSTCSTAIQYSSAAVNLTVYTPNCWDPGSSLSHFEDMCVTNTVSPACYTANGHSNNNLYYVMADFTATGDCFVKRFLQEEERLVLCDLGYSVQTTYTSNAVIDGTLSAHHYTAGSCASAPLVYGLHDGLANGAYIYTTTGTSTVIPYTTLLSNDFPLSGLTVSCLELMLGNATLSQGVSDFTVTAPLGSGLVVLKYYPRTSSGQVGNVTYVYLFFNPSDCNPPGLCNLIQNGGFDSGTNCGSMLAPTGAYVNCWVPVSGLNYYYVRNCTQENNSFNLGNSTLGAPPGAPVDSHNGLGNGSAVALHWPNFFLSQPGAVKNNLSAPLVPGHTYQLSLYANNYLDLLVNNVNPVVISVATSSVYAFVPAGVYPFGMNVVAEFTIQPGTSWSALTHTFVFSPSDNMSHHALMVGIDYGKTLSVPGTSWNPQGSTIMNPSNGIFCFIDDMAVSEFSPAFSIPSPTICGNQGFTDLAQYVSPATAGSFSGNHVSFNNGQYHFNAGGILTPSVYPIGFSYTNTANSCTNTLIQLVSIGSNTNFVALNPLDVCIHTPTVNFDALLTNTTLAGTTYTLNGTPLSGPLYTFTAPGHYTLSASNIDPGLCSNSIYTTAVFVSDPSILVTTTFPSTVAANSFTMCSIDPSYTLYTLGNAAVTIWQPGNVIGGVWVTLSPTVSTIYTLTAYDFTTCVYTQTVAATVFTNCCPPGIPSFTDTTIPISTSLTGPLVMANSFTIAPNQKLNLVSGEFLFAPGARLTVSNSATLEIRDSHLYACSAEMWQGIAVEDGGYVSTARENVDNLIEDAVVAIDILPQTTTNAGLILEAYNTTFNKNYVSIRVSDYTKTLSPYPFFINSCVFTCRDLTTTPTAWPQTGMSSSSSDEYADLRYVNPALTPTTGLDPPYLNQSTFTVTTLKYPYTSQPSHAAIQLYTVGVLGTGTTGLNNIQIGTAGAAYFNLFDAHGQGIAAYNSNVRLINNVFQNTQTYTVSQGTLVSAFGGAGVWHSTEGVQNTELLMQGASPEEGNRFWNCHRGLEGKNPYKLWIEKAIFRSNQSLTTPAFAPVGIQIATNRFDYTIHDNAFHNLSQAINIPIASGAFTLPPGYTPPPTPYYNPGIFADRLRIHANTLEGHSGGTSYMNDAISVTAVNNFYWYGAVDNSLSPTTKAVAITANTLSSVYRGIYVNGITAFPTFIENNEIVLEDDGSLQHGIKLTNTRPALLGSVGGLFYGKSTVALNTSSFSAGPTNTNSALVFMGHNGYSLNSPSVTCNTLANGSQGFVFDGPQTSAIWMGNTMEPLDRGLSLSNNGKIGVQGGSTYASANLWSSGWGVTNYHTYVDLASNAVNSVLYVSNTAGYIPVNNDGGFPSQTYAQAGNILPATGGGYNCYGIPSSKPILVPNNDDDFLSAELFYIENLDFYRFLQGNDSIRDSDAARNAFYEDWEDQSIGQLLKIEERLYEHNYAGARALLLELGEGGNVVEQNYKAFYSLYASYLEAGALSLEQKAQLYQLARLCPGTHGAVVYQARALCNFLYLELLHPDCDTETGARAALADQHDQQAGTNALRELQIFPNPAKDQLWIKTGKEREQLHVIVNDLSGRTVLDRAVEVKGFFANLEMDLINGAYLIYIRNAEHETSVKKLLIAK
jgi:hypothetical protein